MYSNVQIKHIKHLQRIAQQLNTQAINLVPHAKYCIANNLKLASNSCTHYASAHLTTLQQLNNLFTQHNVNFNFTVQNICNCYNVTAQAQCIVYALKHKYINNTCTTFSIVVLNTQAIQSTYCVSYNNANITKMHAVNNAIQQL